MNCFCFFKNITGKLYQGCGNTDRAGKNVDVKTGSVNTSFKQQTSFLDKTEVFAKRKIGKGVVNKKQAEYDHW